MTTNALQYPLGLEGPDHAIRAGFLLGILWRHGIKAETGVDDDGNYTNRITVRDHSTLSGPEELVLEIALIPRKES